MNRTTKYVVTMTDKEQIETQVLNTQGIDRWMN